MLKRIFATTVPSVLLLALLLCLSVSTTGRAQNNSRSVRTAGRDAAGAGHSVTIGVPSFFDGFTAVTYEHRLNARMTIAAAAGITYNSYFMQVRDQRLRDEAFNGSMVRQGPGRYDVEEEFNNRFYHVAKPGVYLALTPKLYLNRKAMNGYYIAPMLEFRNYRFRAYRGNESIFYAPYLMAVTEKSVQRVREEVSESFRCYDVSAIFGGHHQMQKHLVLGYHLGIGLRHGVTDRLDFGLERVEENFYRFTNGDYRVSETRLIANFGFSVGGFW